MPKALPPKDPAEKVTVRFDFSRAGTSAANAVADVAVISGTDALIDLVADGTPTVTGAYVDQMFSGGLAGVNYGISMQADVGDETLVLAAMLPVREKITTGC